MKIAPGCAPLPARQSSITVRVIEDWRAGSGAHPGIFRRLYPKLEFILDIPLADDRALFWRPSQGRAVKLDDDPALVAEILHDLQRARNIDHALSQFDEVVFRFQRPSVE